MEVPILLSTPSESFPAAARVAPGVEVKLDWNDVAQLGDQYTVADACSKSQLNPGNIVSVHLPPGTTDRHGMTATTDNIGTITDFTHTTFGEAVDPKISYGET